MTQLFISRRTKAAACIAAGTVMLSALAGCGALPPTNASAKACATGFDSVERDTLYFGRAIPAGGQVSDAQWTAFLDATVTPAFPQGLTVIDATGQWRGASGGVVREPSKLVVLLHPRSAKDDEAIATIIDTYRKNFGQEAVLQERQSACVRF
ncbi:DUF3574 domain-containing protein [Variovorax sp. KBW07]|uniref:DUF3574 domain-containing protein n=1 Tax=Variovorax sp. KBW07 TaxID=2153358 RepID=UPI000F55A553|nr:DUF3574 domain-containing protein [Variovorax sp. KBW07]RQO49744.1 DUF3574 domain-containing protein [Variovorax sp. KBW07]